MQYYNFTRLINKYSSVLRVIAYSDNTINDLGDYEKSVETQEEIKGAVISRTESKIYRAEGTLNANDKRLFTLTPLKKALKGSKVVYEDKVYSVEDNVDNSKFTGCYAYTLKYVSAFDRGAKND